MREEKGRLTGRHSRRVRKNQERICRNQRVKYHFSPKKKRREVRIQQEDTPRKTILKISPPASKRGNASRRKRYTKKFKRKLARKCKTRDRGRSQSGGRGGEKNGTGRQACLIKPSRSERVREGGQLNNLLERAPLSRESWMQRVLCEDQKKRQVNRSRGKDT